MCKRCRTQAPLTECTGEGDGTSAGIESEVAEVPIEVAGVEGELESAEVENPLEVRIVVSCTVHSPPPRPHGRTRFALARSRLAKDQERKRTYSTDSHKPHHNGDELPIELTMEEKLLAALLQANAELVDHPLLRFGSKSTADGVVQRMCILTRLCPRSKPPDLNFLPRQLRPEEHPHSPLPNTRNKTQHPSTPP